MTINIIFRVPIIIFNNNIEISDNINNVILKSTSHNILIYWLVFSFVDHCEHYWNSITTVYTKKKKLKYKACTFKQKKTNTIWT